MEFLDRKLYLVFNTSNGKTHTLVIDSPTEEPNQDTINTAMDQILTNSAISGPNGEVVSKKEAYVITREITRITMI
jgi:phosphoribosylformylglycinamidine (FGAM) synthase PurS component